MNDSSLQLQSMTESRKKWPAKNKQPADQYARFTSARSAVQGFFSVAGSRFLPFFFMARLYLQLFHNDFCKYARNNY